MSEDVRIEYRSEGVEATVNGAPLSEMALEANIGPCVRCGVEAKESEAGELINIYVENNVLRGDSICVSCLRDMPDDYLVGIEDWLEKIGDGKPEDNA